MSAPDGGPAAWAAVYAGYDDTALATLGSAGLLRRARKEVTAGKIEVLEGRADGAVLRVGGAHVALDARGPAAVRCACPTSGVCQHVLAACLWAREAATGDRTPAPATVGAAPTGTPAVDPVADALALDTRALHRAAGAAVVRSLAEVWRTPPADAGATHVEIDGPRAVVTWPGSPRVTYVAGAGFGGMLVDRTRTAGATGATGATGTTGARGGTKDERWRLEAVVRVAHARGASWPWPDPPAPGRSAAAGVPDARDVSAEVARAVEDVLDVGLSHLGRDDVEPLRAAGALARLGRRPAVQRLVLSATGRLDALVDRRDAVDERECLLALAELWAYAHADPAPDAALPDEREVDLPRLVPLGARWWVAASGARGVTVHLWDAAEGRTRSVATGRPAGADPTFRRSWDLALVWGRSVQALCRGPFALRGAVERGAADLRPGEGPVLEPAGVLTAQELHDVAASTASAGARGEVGFGRRSAAVRVVMVRETGAVGVDEVAQELTWELVAADGSPTVVRVDAADGAACDTLLGVAAGGRRVVAVAVERDLTTGTDEAVGLFVAGAAGALELVVPTLTPAHGRQTWSTSWTRVRARVRALRGRAPTHGRDVVVPAPVEDVCQALLDVVVALAATGRRHLTPHQAAVVARAARTADDLGAATLARAVALVAPVATGPGTPGVPDAAALLRATLVAARALALARAVAPAAREV